MRTPVAVRILLLAMVCLVPAACGGSDDNNTSGAAPATSTATVTTSAASPACADAAALKASMAELDQIDPAKDGKAGIQAALDKVRTNLQALKTSAKSEWSSQITALDSALEGLKTTITGINGDNVLSAVPAIVDDLKQIDASWTTLEQQIEQDCG
jgi:Zn-dependent oligopeptidase